MALTADQQVQTIRELLATEPGPFSFSKAEIKAAIDAADAWCGTNAAVFNAALPNPFKTNASASLKAALLAFVALRRAGK